jgi:hypothetical protein
MKVIFRIVVCVSCLLAGLRPSSAQQDPMPFFEECSFYLSFDYGDVNADIAMGEHKGVQSLLNRKPLFQKGLKGQALLLGGESVQGVGFKSAGNFSYTKPGTLSMWLQPVKWVRGDDRPIDPQNPAYREITYTIFFSTPFSGKGYLGLQRMTLPATRLGENLFFWSYSFEKIPNAHLAPKLDWADGTWHHVALTWKGQEITLYMDGKQAGDVVLKAKIENEDHINTFNVGIVSEPTLVDEVSLYSRAFSNNDITNLYRSYKK